MERAIEFEVRRQIELLEDGGTVVQETRLYDPERDETRSMRSKEDAQDYRYFPDPDLLPLVITEQEIERVRRELPELPEAKRARFVREYGLPAYDAALVTASRAAADFFERAGAGLGRRAEDLRQLADRRARRGAQPPRPRHCGEPGVAARCSA